MLDLKYEFYINAKPEKVWEVFISPEGTKAIFFGCVLNSTFEIGSPYAYVGPGSEGDETVHVYGEVLAFEPNLKMSYTEHPGPSYRENHAELETRVTLTLDVVGNCTKLTLVNDQWPENHPSYESTQSSWPMILSNIKSYVETGETLDFGW
ncbi:polyketide cyclase [Paenibacillus ferrarius]|uniref:Polyketide cyclase n=1 Tax=Paenibacillus ferrarius TaxID=1469647 RepID=A0A1V4HB89_9BACL|nr:SRPBCC family protein [Paenibacillus ferrarius]OPH49021.1 polyketide cyclase [Paenibacillus ferrarius]